MSEGDAPAAIAYRIFRFRAGTVDSIWCGDRRAFLFAAPGAAPLMAEGVCPHRGGPLALGHYDCRTASLRCPWHGHRYTRRQIEAMAWPAVRAGADWLVVLPAKADPDRVIGILRGLTDPVSIA